MKKKEYVQFSKRIIVAVTAAVTVLCTAAVVLCWFRNDTESIVKVVETYIWYAGLAFASYSGNSIAEKWMARKYASTSSTESEDIPNG